MVVFLSACAAAEPGGLAGAPAVNLSPQTTALPDYGAAPEMTNQVWLNVDAPLRLAELGGKVVLLDMWTYG
jgi:hypothetical protein